jgi:two-component system, OmpR family, alkaline phosphatase synthesis response regulator PhoP
MNFKLKTIRFRFVPDCFQLKTGQHGIVFAERKAFLINNECFVTPYPLPAQELCILFRYLHVLTNCELNIIIYRVEPFRVGLQKFHLMNAKGKILIADDEPDILEIIRYNLTKEGYEIVTANNGDDAIQKAKLSQPDLIILDIMMPRKNGVEVCEILRAQPAFKDTVIVFLTALSDESSHVKGLETGADDYISKPVSPKILVSRIHAIFRRINKEPEEKVIKIDNLEIDPVKFEAKVDSKAVVLAKKEFELLYLLASKPGRVFLRNEILNQIWGNDVIVGDRTIDVHIRKIRQKLGIDCITTVKGVGYKFTM